MSTDNIPSKKCCYWDAGPQWPLTSEVVHVPMQPEDDSRRIPMEISAEAWKEYAAQGHGDQSHQRMIQRGGFGSVELAILLFQRIKRLEGNEAPAHETSDYLMVRDAHDRVAAELERYKRCLYRANGRLIQLDQEPEKLDYPDRPESKASEGQS